MRNIIGCKKFNTSDQERFAELSGDVNPLHIDPIYARREIFGDVVVHGMHATLYALESFLSKWEKKLPPCMFLDHVSGKFLDPIYLKKKVEIDQTSHKKQQASWRIWQGNQICQEIEMQWHSTPDQTQSPTHSVPSSLSAIPENLSFDELAEHKGNLELYIDQTQAESHFPQIAKRISQDQLKNLLALTRLVGMHCPGFHSVFLGFDVTFNTHTPTSHLYYTVTRADKRFSSIQMTVENETISGKVYSRYRPKPVEQPKLRDLQFIVADNEFMSQKALIVGGSRGLGETTAKLIAAGEGQVIITYHQGAQDAERIAAELTEQAKHCAIWQHTIGSSDSQGIDLSTLGTPPTHLYFFASPKIIPQRGNSYATHLFAHFTHFYVDALFDLYQNYRHNWPEAKLHIFFPSTIYLNNPQKGLTEYCAAKAAGETLCGHLGKTDPNLTITIERLPQIATDQTMSFMNKQVENPQVILLPILRKINQAATSSDCDIS
jgi:acyl dehydratase